MTPAELAAYIGAAAWLPQIGTWLYRKFSHSVITIVPAPTAEVGFTSYGPILNIRMTFSAEHKDAVVDGFQLLLRHSDGDAHTLRWTGIRETLSEFQDAEGRRQEVYRDQTPIAIKIGTESLMEKSVRFQESRYHDVNSPLLGELVSHFKFLQQSGDPDYVGKVLSSKEFFKLMDSRQKAFWWKPGKYDVTLHLSSLRKTSLAQPAFSFTLSSLDVDQLKRNVETVKTDLEDTIKSNLPDFKVTPLNWNWVYPDVSKTTPSAH